MGGGRSAARGNVSFFSRWAHLILCWNRNTSILSISKHPDSPKKAAFALAIYFSHFVTCC
jgi:hypothetical protein